MPRSRSRSPQRHVPRGLQKIRSSSIAVTSLNSHSKNFSPESRPSTSKQSLHGSSHTENSNNPDFSTTFKYLDASQSEQETPTNNRQKKSKNSQEKLDKLERDVSQHRSSEGSPFDAEELKKIKVVIERKLRKPSNEPIIRTVIPEEVVVIRRPDEGTHAIFDREEIRNTETRIVYSSDHGDECPKEKSQDFSRTNHGKRKTSTDKSYETDSMKDSPKTSSHKQSDRHKRGVSSENFSSRSVTYHSDSRGASFKDRFSRNVTEDYSDDISRRKSSNHKSSRSKYDDNLHEKSKHRPHRKSRSHSRERYGKRRRNESPVPRSDSSSASTKESRSQNESAPSTSQYVEDSSINQDGGPPKPDPWTIGLRTVVPPPSYPGFFRPLPPVPPPLPRPGGPIMRRLPPPVRHGFIPFPPVPRARPPFPRLPLGMFPPRPPPFW